MIQHKGLPTPLLDELRVKFLKINSMLRLLTKRKKEDTLLEMPLAAPGLRLSGNRIKGEAE